LSCDPPFKRFLASLGADLLDNAPIFRTAGSEPGPKGGRRRLPQPYSTSKMDRDFREIHRAVFGPDEERQLADMRRSGAVEADAGRASDTDLANKMANTIDKNQRLRKTYNAVNVVSVLRIDKARERGRERRDQRPTKSVVDPGGECHDPERKTEILQRFPGGSDGTRTRDLRRDRPTL
jgi:hypothetical protein